MGGLKHEKGTKAAFFGIGIINPRAAHVQQFGRESKISGSLADSVAKTLIYGKQRKSATDLEIGKIKKALRDIAKQLRSESNGRGAI